MTAATQSALVLFAWLSPSFPTGAFAYSHGLEWAREAGDIVDRATLEGWIGDLLDHGGVRNDLVLLAAAYRALAAGRDDVLKEVAELAIALAPTQERHLETVQQGNAFLKAVEAAWAAPGVARFRATWPHDVGLPVAVGVAAAAHALTLRATAETFAFAFVSNLVSAAIRLGVVGQTDGQRLIAAFAPSCRALGGWSEDTTLDDLGGCAFRSDLASACHETQYTRLFRS